MSAVLGLISKVGMAPTLAERRRATSDLASCVMSEECASIGPKTAERILEAMSLSLQLEAWNAEHQLPDEGRRGVQYLMEGFHCVSHMLEQHTGVCKPVSSAAVVSIFRSTLQLLYEFNCDTIERSVELHLAANRALVAVFTLFPQECFASVSSSVATVLPLLSLFVLPSKFLNVFIESESLSSLFGAFIESWASVALGVLLPLVADERSYTALCGMQPSVITLLLHNVQVPLVPGKENVVCTCRVAVLEVVAQVVGSACRINSTLMQHFACSDGHKILGTAVADYCSYRPDLTPSFSVRPLVQLLRSLLLWKDNGDQSSEGERLLMSTFFSLGSQERWLADANCIVPNPEQRRTVSTVALEAAALAICQCMRPTEGDLFDALGSCLTFVLQTYPFDIAKRRLCTQRVMQAVQKLPLSQGTTDVPGKVASPHHVRRG